MFQLILKDYAVRLFFPTYCSIRSSWVDFKLSKHTQSTIGLQQSTAFDVFGIFLGCWHVFTHLKLDDGLVTCSALVRLFSIRWHSRSGSEEPRQSAAAAKWMWRAEHGSPRPQHLHPRVPERHRAAHLNHRGKGYQLSNHWWVQHFSKAKARKAKVMPRLGHFKARSTSWVKHTLSRKCWK